MKRIPFASNYIVSNKGEVFSRHIGRTRLTKIKGGYLRVTLVCDDVKLRSFLVHRLVAMLYLSNPENKPEVNHKDGNKENNNVDNLEWVTREENQQHAFSNGLNDNTGENNGRALLTEEDVLNIYYSLGEGARIGDMAKKYNVSTACITDIMKKRNWYYLLKDLPNIPSRDKKSRLSEKTIRWVCSLIQEGKTPSEIFTLSTNKLLSKNQIYDIKRRKMANHISKEYVW